MLSRLSLCRHSRASLSQVETVTLTPWEKRQRGYFPYQILLHLFILILLVLQVTVGTRLMLLKFVDFFVSVAVYGL